MKSINEPKVLAAMSPEEFKSLGGKRSQINPIIEIFGILITDRGVCTNITWDLESIQAMKNDKDKDCCWIKINGKWEFLCVAHGISMFMEMKP